MNRKERRSLKEEINIFSDVVNIMKQYFPKLIDRFEKLTDARHPSYIEYQISVITSNGPIFYTSNFNACKNIKNMQVL